MQPVRDASSQAAAFDSQRRAAQIRRIVEECMVRRARGEHLPDESVTASHADLMPELAEELSLLSLMERARLYAASSQAPDLHSLAAAGTASNVKDLLAFRGYDVQNEIHRGGQGAVFEAVQKSTGRSVAIKVLHESRMPSPRDVARFDREVHVLALLRHPHLVSILDSGTIAGRHYLVMDLVRGKPLHQFEAGDAAGGAARDVPMALRRFVKICDAVSAAHLRGVIHRDIKPANIIVDEHGEPRVLDFGLARVLEGGSVGAQTVTHEGQFVGSLPWASPEQAGGATETLDIRSDVYSLGVVLYQVLTGRFPYPVEGNWRSIADHIAQTRPTSPRSLRPELGKDLETIILKCLAKEPERRYQSAGELRDDVARCLSGEPIAARSDSAWYLAGKLAARHRVAAAVSLAFVLLIAGSAILATWLYRRELAAAGEAARAAQQAAAESAKFKAINAFLNDMLSAPHPDQAGKDVKVVDVLHAGEESLAERFGGEPLVEAAVRHTLGDTYFELGQLEDAEKQFRAARALRLEQLDSGSDEVFASTHGLAAVLWTRGALEEAESLVLEAIAARGLDTDTELSNDDDAELLRLHNSILNMRGRFEKTVENAQRILDYSRSAHGPTHANTIAAMNSLAFALDCNQREGEAEPIYREALALAREHLPPDHGIAQAIGISLANLLRAVGRNDEAEPFVLEVLESRRRTLPPEHAGIGDCLMELAAIQARKGDNEKSIASINEAVRIHRAALGDDSWRTAGTRAMAANILAHTGYYKEAESHAIPAFETLEKTWGEHPQVEAGISGVIVNLYQKWGKPEEAARWRERIEKLASSHQADQ